MKTSEILETTPFPLGLDYGEAGTVYWPFNNQVFNPVSFVKGVGLSTGVGAFQGAVFPSSWGGGGAIACMRGGLLMGIIGAGADQAFVNPVYKDPPDSHPPPWQRGTDTPSRTSPNPFLQRFPAAY
jgi:hypothetical protein